MIIRAKSIAAFQQAIIDERIERNLHARSRTDNQMSYKLGQSVDFYKKSERKQLEGWRGPAVILQLLGEGSATIRWQTQVYDIPVNLIRPHIFRTPITAQAQPEPAKPDPNAPKALGDKSQEDPTKDKDSAEQIAMWEEYYFSEAHDNPTDDNFAALVSCASSMPPCSQVIHGIVNKNGVLYPTEPAIRDSCVLYHLGRHAASNLGISNFIGFILACGRRQINGQGRVKCFHVYWWTGDAVETTLHHATVEGGKSIDFVNGFGIAKHEVIHLKCILFLEGFPTHGPPLHELLKLPEPEEPKPQTGRVRFPLSNEDSTPSPNKQDHESEIASTKIWKR